MSPKLSHLVILSLLLSLNVACGKKKKAAAPPAPPCATGINQSLCSNELVEESIWTRSFDVLQTDAATGENKLTNSVNIVQRFSPSKEGPVWERSMTLSYPDGRASETMIIGGKILGIDKEALRVTVDYSSCDGIGESFSIQPSASEPDGRKLYYKRIANSLTLRTRPFVEVETTPVQGNIAEQLIGGMINHVVAATIAATMEMMIEVTSELVVQTMTFGLYRDHLKEGAGSYIASDIKDFESLEKSFAVGQVGCFYAKGEAKGKFATKAEEVLEDSKTPEVKDEDQEPASKSWWESLFKKSE